VPAINLQPRYNIAPTTTIDAVIPRGADRLELMQMRWGLIPSLVEKDRQGSPLDLQRPRRDGGREADVPRCLQAQPLRDPGFGLLRVEADTDRQADLLHLGRQRLGAFVRWTWDEWYDLESGEIVKSCTIIVTAANDFTRKIHRMPVVLEQFEPWLTGAAGAEVLKPAPEDMLQMWPVSRKVNRVGNDSDPTLNDAIQRDLLNRQRWSQHEHLSDYLRGRLDGVRGV
jgi:putative SOS response-associated peptidase YedK